MDRESCACDRAKALSLRLAADGGDLFFGDVHLPAVADTCRRKKFDDVGAVLFELTHSFTKSAWCVSGLRDDLFQRSQQPRPDRLTGGDGIPKLAIARPSERLDGGESRHQHRAYVGFDRLLFVARREVALPVLSARPEKVLRVHMDIDHARHQRGRSEVVGDRTGRGSFGADGRNLGADNGDDRPFEDSAAPVDDACRLECDAATIRNRCRRRRPLPELCRNRNGKHGACRQCQNERNRRFPLCHNGAVCLRRVILDSIKRMTVDDAEKRSSKKGICSTQIGFLRHEK